MHRRQVLGQWGEDHAAAFLEGHGYRVVARNWRTSVEDLRGEMDLVATDGTTLAFVEVKTRRGAGFGGPAQAVGWDKRARLRRLAGAYLAQSPWRGPVRGDVVTVEVRPPDPPNVAHLKGVW